MYDSAFKREYSYFKLKKARKPQTGYNLAGYIMVHKGVAVLQPISFSAKFVEAVGKALPRGISADSQAYLQLYQLPTKKWALYASYLSEYAGVRLLVYDDKPVWVD